ncbi:MAG: hypothetical protein ACK515_20720 [bacterium]|jgi:hypothetical protein|nr:hypothetical protein [Betaproteobacteria bacterium]
MIHGTVGTQAMQGRRLVKSSGSEEVHWRTDFLGQPSSGEIKCTPQAFLIEMTPGEVILPHFHEVDQFQVFVAGGGGVGRTNDVVAPIAVHYADRYTGYGPINAGPQGYSYFTLRARSDAGAVYLHKPGYREKLKPSRKRHHLAPITLSTEPVLFSRTENSLETLIEASDTHDGLAAFVLRMGPSARLSGPDPRGTGGQYYLVLNGSLERDGVSYPAWSTLFVDADEGPLDVNAGEKGLEVAILQFAHQDPTLSS